MNFRIDGEERGTFTRRACGIGRLRAGKRAIEITLYSGNRNLYGPFHFAPDTEPYGVGVTQFTLAGSWDGRRSPLYRQSYARVAFGLGKASAVV